MSDSAFAGHPRAEAAWSTSMALSIAPA